MAGLGSSRLGRFLLHSLGKASNRCGSQQLIGLRLRLELVVD
jgi:hypothetical protein